MAPNPSVLTIGGGGRQAAPASGRAGGFGMGKNTGAMLAYLTSLFAPSMNQPGLAPLTPAQIKQQAAGDVTAAINPQIAALRSANTAATAGGVGSIRGGTANYAGAVAPIAGQVAQIGKDQAAEDTRETGALADYLKSSGASTFGDVGSKLSAAGIDAPAAPNMGEGSAAITAATGLANARDATAEGGNNSKLAALLPGFANLAGQKAENDFRADQQGNLNTQVGSLEGQVPGLTQNVLRDINSNETAKGSARSSAAGNRATALSTFLGNSVDDTTQLGLAKLSGLFGVQKADAAASAPSSALSAKAGVIVDHNNNVIPGADGKPQPIFGAHLDPKTGKPVKDVSPASVASAGKAKQSALTSADSAVRSIVGGAFKTAAKKGSASAGPFGGGTTGKPEIGSPAYNMAVNEAVKSAETILGPYMSTEDIVKFVQQRALLTGWAQRKQPAAPAVTTAANGIKSSTAAFSPAG